MAVSEKPVKPIERMQRTDNHQLAKGIRRLALTVTLMFLGPIIIYQAFKNQGHPLYWPVLTIGILIAGIAIFMGFKSIQTLMNALFGNTKKK